MEAIETESSKLAPAARLRPKEQARMRPESRKTRNQWRRHAPFMAAQDKPICSGMGTYWAFQCILKRASLDVRIPIIAYGRWRSVVSHIGMPSLVVKKPSHTTIVLLRLEFLILLRYLV